MLSLPRLRLRLNRPEAFFSRSCARVPSATLLVTLAVPLVSRLMAVVDVPLDGSAPQNLTNGAGAKSEMRFRYVRTEPLEPGAALDPTEPTSQH